MTWYFEGTPFEAPNPNPYEGFIYLIENLITGKKYIGKKHFWIRQKNKKTNRRQTKESSWRDYYSSSEDLQKDVELHGKENFKRTILHLCIYKKQMTFLEQKEQWDRNVLMTDDYYNTNIGGKFFVRERKIYQSTAKVKDITDKNDKWREIKRQQMTGDGNVAKREDVRKKISAKKAGVNHHQYGKPITEDHKAKLLAGCLKAVVCTWEVTFPDNSQKIIQNMNEFCKENNLSVAGMNMVASGKRRHHKNFKCKKLS